MARCTKCGADVPGRFCPECGTEAPAQQPPAPPAPPVAAAYQMPPNPQYPPQAPQPYGAPPEKPKAVWQGVLTLVVTLLISAFVGLGLTGVEGADVADAKVGAYAVMGLAGLIGLPFGIWSLVSNRTAGKVMAAIGLGVWALVLIMAIAW